MGILDEKTNADLWLEMIKKYNFKDDTHTNIHGYF